MDRAYALSIDYTVIYIDYVVNNADAHTELAPRIRWLSAAVGAYVAVTLGTIAALTVLSRTAPRLATQEAWGHAIIVAALALVLLLRLRAARRGSSSALQALRIIALVLLVVNTVEAVLPDAFPPWMRVEMVGIAVLMLLVVVLSSRSLPTPGRGC